MKRGYRKSILIVRDILRNCREPINTLRLLTKTNLSHSFFKGWGTKLLENQLIFRENDYYLISPKGKKLLGKIEEILVLFADW